MKKKKEKLMKQYYDEKILWTEKAIDQLGYVNNLILVFSVGFIAYAFNEEFKLAFNIDYPTLSSGACKSYSLLFMYISSFAGIIVTLSRLADLRITRQKAIIKYSLMKYTDKNIFEVKPKHKCLSTRLKILANTLTVKNFNKEGAEHENINTIYKKNSAVFSNKYRTLSDDANACGKTSWDFFLIQIITFTIALFIFLNMSYNTVILGVLLLILAIIYLNRK